jgi:uncharacterized coiled-coil protein SlyX
MNDGSEDERFVRLEIKLAYLEKLTLELNEVVIAQGQVIDALNKRLSRLEGQVNTSTEGREFPHEKPPHY